MEDTDAPDMAGAGAGVGVRDAIRADADDIAATHIASWRVGYTHIFPRSVFDDPDFDRSRVAIWRSWTHSPTADRRLVVGTLDGRIRGLAHTGLVDDSADDADAGCGELFGFYAHPEVWGTAVAPRMMDSALESLASLGVPRAVVWTFARADRARAFYEKSGWSLTDRTDVWDRYPDHPVDAVQLAQAL